MLIWPPTRLTMILGIKNGLTRRWPFSTAAMCVSSSVASPPMPEPTMTPVRSPSGSSVGSPASSSASFAAARPNWMKRSLRRASFLSMNCAASKPFTSPAMWQGSSEASKRVIGPTPLLPAIAACHVASVPIPRGVTSPRPVTTTLRSTLCILMLARGQRLKPEARSRQPGLLLVLVDEVDRVLHGLDVLGLFVRDLDLELLLHRHHQLDDIERVGAQVLDEGGLHLDLVLADPKLLSDDALDLRLDGHGRSFRMFFPKTGLARPCNMVFRDHKSARVRKSYWQTALMHL